MRRFAPPSIIHPRLPTSHARRAESGKVGSEIDLAARSKAELREVVNSYATELVRLEYTESVNSRIGKPPALPAGPRGSPFK